MKKNIISFAALIIVLTLICYSCSKNVDKDIKILKLPESGEEVLKTSYFADTVIYVPLETTEESLIKDIYSLWVNDSIILILHGYGLLKFNINGKFIKQIGTRGRGPGEYRGIFDFKVARDTIYLSTVGRGAFLRYTLDGTFCDEIQLSFQPVCFNVTADQKLATFNAIEGKVYVYNNSFTLPDTIVVEYGVSELRRIRSADGEMLFTKFQKTSSGLLFSNYLNDTIWNIAGDKKEPAFILDTKDKLLPWDKQLEYYTMDNTPEFLEMAKSYHLFNLVPASSNMFIFQDVWYNEDEVQNDHYAYDAVYFVNTKTGKIRKFDYIFDDIVGKQKLTWFYHIYSEDYLVGEISSYKVLNDPVQSKEAREAPSLAWLNQMKNIKEDDNPILVLVKFKKDL